MFDYLPTRVRLRQKQMDVPDYCPMCNGDSETISHVLVSCSFAISCWFMAGLVNGVLVPISFDSWLADSFDRWNNDQRCKASMLCWAI